MRTTGAGEPIVTPEEARKMLEEDATLLVIQADTGRFVAQLESIDQDSRRADFIVFARIDEPVCRRGEWPPI